jgi:multidrug efflux pump subunit AcrA (membrane-fusion protein)
MKAKRRPRAATVRKRRGLLLICFLVLLALMGIARYNHSPAGFPAKLRARLTGLWHPSPTQGVSSFFASLVGAKPPDVVFVPTTTVRAGSFDVSLVAVGSLKSKVSQPVVSDAFGTIVWTVEDGTRVKKGDPILQLQNDMLVRQLQDKATALANAQQTLADTKRDRSLEWENAKTDYQKGQQELELLRAQDKSALEQAEAQLEFQKTDLALSRVQQSKDDRLAQEKLVPQTQADADAAAVKAKEFAYEKGKGDLALKKGQLDSGELTKQQDVGRLKFAADMAKGRIDSEVRNAQLNVDTTKKQQDDLLDQIKKSQITAPADGIVVLATTRDSDNVRPLQPGDQVGKNQKICDLPDLSRMQVALEVEQRDIGPIRVGLPVRIHLDPFPDRVYHGRVVEVAQVAKASSIEGSWWDANKNTFTTLIDIQEADPERLRPGMNATLEIYSSHLDHVTYIPVEALFHPNDQPIAYLQQAGEERSDRPGFPWAPGRAPGHFRAVPLVLGPRNKDKIVVRQGLKLDQRIALVPPPASMISGESPSPRRAGQKAVANPAIAHRLPLTSNQQHGHF